MTPTAGERVGILLSTYNGARFLPAQLDSFCRQTEPGWTLFWRDDGSTDETLAVMAAFAEGAGQGRCVAVDVPGHLGASGSFFALLRAVASTGLPLAFADQDDVWLPEKLDWALSSVAALDGPALYCTRQLLVDDALRPIGPSAAIRRTPGFPAALTQNIATGCTTVLNAEAVRLVAATRPPPGTLHDWWSYLVVAASRGRVIVDQRPSVLYRQHGGNLVGAPPTAVRRARAALRRGPAAFMDLLRVHVGALLERPDLLGAEAVETLRAIDAALRGGWRERASVLRRHGLERQTRLETALFRWWFLVG